MSEPEKPNKKCAVCHEKINRREGCEQGSCWYCEMKCCQTCCDISGKELFDSWEKLENIGIDND